MDLNKKLNIELSHKTSNAFRKKLVVNIVNYLLYHRNQIPFPVSEIFENMINKKIAEKNYNQLKKAKETYESIENIKEVRLKLKAKTKRLIKKFISDNK